MAGEFEAPRKTWMMALIALTFGAPALMLWVGRLRQAVLYFAANIFLMIVLLAAAVNGLVPVTSVNKAQVYAWLMRLPIDLVAFLHASFFEKNLRPRPQYARWYIALPAVPAATYALAILVRIFLFQPFSIPSGSNIPNLMLGDMFFASKFAYRFANPERGDQVVFKSPKDAKIDYVKRVVGLPGDRVQMKGGRLYLNGTMVERMPETLAPEFSRERRLTFYRETLPGGRSYVIGEEGDDGPLDNTSEFAVPPGHYFVLGDNRDNSADSRGPAGLGFIPRENIFARFACRFWNTEGFALTGRPEEKR